MRRLSHWGYETAVTLRRAGNRKARSRDPDPHRTHQSDGWAKRTETDFPRSPSAGLTALTYGDWYRERKKCQGSAMPKLLPRYAFRLEDLRVSHRVEAACPSAGIER